MPARPPSGQQHELRDGDRSAVVVEVGGGLRSYRVREFDDLDGYAEDEMCTAARGTPLIPWPNRLRDGTYDFGGAHHQVALTEPGKRNAIHGLCRWLNWECTERSAAHVRMRVIIHPQPGYEFTLEATAEYRLTGDGLQVTLGGRNLGSVPLPFGAGQHPYVRVDEGTIDRALLTSPARARQLVDRRQIPTGEVAPVRGRYDFRRPRRIGSTVLDVPLLELERSDGLARVVMEGERRRVIVWQDERLPYLMLFTGDTLAPAERRRGLGVEPMTCAPNAFQSGLGLLTLEPGQAAAATWGIRVEN